MADPVWLAWCQGVGMNQAAVDFMRTDIGVDGPGALRDNVSTTEFTTFLKVTGKQMSSVTPAAGAVRPLFPWGAQKALHALRLYMEYRQAVGLEMTDAAILAFFNVNRRTEWIEHIAKIKEIDTSGADEDVIVVPKLKSLSRWEPFREMVVTKLSTQRNSTLGHRLTYLLRDYEESEQVHLDATYSSLEERIEGCVNLSGPLFQKDNAWLYAYLKGLVVEGDIWTYIQSLEGTNNGRAAWKAIQAQAEGPAATHLRVTTGYAKMNNTKFNGKSKKFTFQSYIRAHTQAHNLITRDTQETLTETNKVDTFLNGISDPSLAAAVAAVKASDDKMSSFQRASQHVLQEYLRLQSSNTTSNYNVAGVATPKAPPQKKQKKAADNSTSKKSKSFQTRLQQAIKEVKAGTFKHALGDVWNSTDFRKYRDTVIQKRNEKKSASASEVSIEAVIQAQVKAQLKKAGITVSAVESVGSADDPPLAQDDNEDEEEDTTPDTGTVDEYESAKAASASSQFGRKGRTIKAASQLKRKVDAVSIGSLDTTPIPKKKNRATLRNISKEPGLSSQEPPDLRHLPLWQSRIVDSITPNIQYHEHLRSMVLGPDKPVFKDIYEELLAYGSTFQSLKVSREMNVALTPVELKRYRFLEHKHKTFVNAAAEDNYIYAHASLAAWDAGKAQATHEMAKKTYHDALKIHKELSKYMAEDDTGDDFQLPSDLSIMLKPDDFARHKSGHVADEECKDPQAVNIDDLSDEDDSDSEYEYE